ncbi:SHOCT domain-containing protein [Streptomyces roseolus]|uniref:SHOCT domain-containing protein n=1 Tax=Streptomyces roseolus TaxID=67358 RepID=UPI001988946D|nr:SHOCT domain-containing protein [Streptomyces roseolus]GGR51216.1 hypothetical protein GCM10010282_50070 [Streptomyces roseolus]
MFMRRRPLARPVVRPAGAPLLRGALVGGAAYAAGRSAARNARREQDQEQAIADLQYQQQAERQPLLREAPAAPPPQAPAAPPSGGQADAGGLTEQLARLGALAQQGLLTAEEFAAAKAKLLGV